MGGGGFFFFFSSRRRHTRLRRDWSSDVCSSDLDLAGTYHNQRSNTTVAAVIKNAGIQIKPYTNKNREPLPFEIQLGIAQRLKHAPFRLMLNVHHLEKWDLTYIDPVEEQSPLIPVEEDT